MGNIIPVRALSGNTHLTIISRDSMTLYTSSVDQTGPGAGVEDGWTPEWQDPGLREEGQAAQRWEAGSPVDGHLVMGGEDGLVDIPMDPPLEMGYSSHRPGLMLEGALGVGADRPRSESTSSMASVSLDSSYTNTPARDTLSGSSKSQSQSREKGHPTSSQSHGVKASTHSE